MTWQCQSAATTKGGFGAWLRAHLTVARHSLACWELVGCPPDGPSDLRGACEVTCVHRKERNNVYAGNNFRSQAQVGKALGARRWLHGVAWCMASAV